MRRLVIVGAGGFGRELHSWIGTSPRWRAANAVDSIVYVDDVTPPVQVAAPIIGTLDGYIPEASDVFLCAIGEPSSRSRITAELISRGGQPINFIHDRALIGESVELGSGVVICPDAILSNHVNVGDNVQINTGCAIGHDVRIGAGCTLSGSVNLTGNVTIGDGVFFGTAATVLPGLRVGQNSVIGAGSMVMKDVPNDVTVFGNPSRTVGVVRT